MLINCERSTLLFMKQSVAHIQYKHHHSPRWISFKLETQGVLILLQPASSHNSQTVALTQPVAVSCPWLSSQQLLFVTVTSSTSSTHTWCQSLVAHYNLLLICMSNFSYLVIFLVIFSSFRFLSNLGIFWTIFWKGRVTVFLSILTPSGHRWCYFW